ncbi:hypothetical protein ACB094_01G324900 [Castanea mollissima]
MALKLKGHKTLIFLLVFSSITFFLTPERRGRSGTVPTCLPLNIPSSSSKPFSIFPSPPSHHLKIEDRIQGHWVGTRKN